MVTATQRGGVHGIGRNPTPTHMRGKLSNMRGEMYLTRAHTRGTLPARKLTFTMSVMDNAHPLVKLRNKVDEERLLYCTQLSRHDTRKRTHALDGARFRHRHRQIRPEPLQLSRRAALYSCLGAPLEHRRVRVSDSLL